MWTGSDSLKVSSQQERKSKPISHNARDFFFKQFFIQFILFLAFVHGDPDDLMVWNASFQTATLSLKTKTEWCRSRRSSARTTPPSRGPASGEPAGQPSRLAAKRFGRGRSWRRCAYAPAAVAGFLYRGCERRWGARHKRRWSEKKKKCIHC